MKSQLTNEERLSNLIEFGKMIIDECRKNELEIRYFGSVGVYYQCLKKTEKIDSIRWIKDLDLIFKEQDDLPDILTIFQKHGFEYSKELMVQTEGKRTVLYREKDNDFTIDLISNPFNYAQTIDFEKRFSIDEYSLSVTDLFLTRMQPIKLEQKDIVDIMLLIDIYGLSENTEDAVNINRVVEVLRKNWGFCHTYMKNMKVLEQNNLNSTVFESLVNATKQSKKTIRWKLRSIFREYLKYYQTVEKIN
ncbi:MAG: hypothetical protein WC879_12095 [Melioribacteraceae bacterium]